MIDKFKNGLSKEQLHILNDAGTEKPFSGKYVKQDKKGQYVCAACGNVLFDSKNKFYSDCGWPSFEDVKKGSVEYQNDYKLVLPRKEVICAKCKGHLGHVFNDGPTKTKKRFCINSLALNFKGD